MTDTNQVLADARDRGEAAIAAAPRPDYAAVNVHHKRQRTALTRAINGHDNEAIRKTVIKAVREWREAPYNGFWPDDWNRWQIALNDTLGWSDHIDLSDIR